MARSRSPLVVMVSGGVQQRLRLPQRQPVPGADADRFYALHPADAGRQVSGANSPLSTASPASLRMADMRMMMDDESRPRGLKRGSPRADRRLAQAGAAPAHTIA